MSSELQPIRSQPDTLRPVPSFGDGSVISDQHRVLRNTYWLLALSLIPTAIGALVGMSIDWSFMRSSPGISMIVMLAVFYGWIYAIERNRTSSLGVGLLLGFTLFMGLLLAPLLQQIVGLKNGGELIAMAAGGTAAVFFGLAAVATTTKRDFSTMGNFLFVGSIVLMLAVIANIFFHSPALVLTILVAFILFSSMMILWQINAIVRGGETNYVSATLTLYVAIYNLFTSLLQILGIFGGNRD